MDLNEVVIFAKVVQAGSFTRAARELDLPKSTVSRKVSELEERLGARLLQRTTRSSSLTDAGRAYYEHAARIVSELEVAESAVSRLEQAPRGRLRITVPLNFGHFAPLVASFLARYREVEIELVCTDRTLDLVEEQFDLAIRASRLADSTLIARPLGTLRSFVAASPAYVKARGAPKKPDDLRDHDCLVFGAGRDRGQYRLARKGKEVSIKVQGRLVTNDFDLLQEAAKSGLGVAVLPLHRIAGDLEAGRLVRVLAEWCTPPLPIQAVYPSTRHLSPKVRAFLDHMAESALPTPWEPVGGAV